MEVIGIGFTLHTGTNVLGIQGHQHIVPTLHFGTQFGCSKCSLDVVFFIDQIDGFCQYAQSVYTEGIKRQSESCGILYRVRRSHKNIGQVGRPVFGNEEMDRSILQNSLMDMEIVVIDKLHHIDRRHEMVRLYDRIILRSGFGIDQQQTVGTQTETGEGGEEGQLHFSYLMFTGDILRGSLPCDRCQMGRCKNGIHYDTHNRDDRHHDAKQRPTNDFKGFFHPYSFALVKVYFQSLLSFS